MLREVKKVTIIEELLFFNLDNSHAGSEEPTI
jgi:hypothetical protein